MKILRPNPVLVPALVLLLAFVTLAVTLPAVASDLPAAAEVLERSIAHHDPEGRWGSAALALTFEESRPDGSTRHTEVTIDTGKEFFSWSSRRDGHDVVGRLEGASCTVSLDGSTEVSPEEAETYGLDCETLTRRRDYYTYLWGLPMKLRDPGTRIDDAVTTTEFEGREVLALSVTYDESVGSDTWYFYFDPATMALAGYRFFHDESQNDGEYITLEGEVELAGLRLPKRRAWFYNNGDGHLGTDTLVGDDATR